MTEASTFQNRNSRKSWERITRDSIQQRPISRYVDLCLSLNEQQSNETVILQQFYPRGNVYVSGRFEESRVRNIERRTSRNRGRPLSRVPRFEENYKLPTRRVRGRTALRVHSLGCTSSRGYGCGGPRRTGSEDRVDVGSVWFYLLI